MSTLFQDLRYALRQLRNAPGFAFTAIMTLALGIGATIGVYTLVDAILLRPLPYADPSKLLVLDTKDSFVSYANLLQISERSGGRLTSAAVLAEWSAKLEAVGRRAPVFIVETTANLPSFLGVEPVLGRSFRPDENEPGKNNVMLLSDRVWRSIFSADPHVIGQTVAVSGGSKYTVIGVMPRTFAMPLNVDDEVWTPRSIRPAARLKMGDEDDAMYVNLAMVRPSSGTLEQAQAEIGQIQNQIVSEHAGLDLPKDLTSTTYLESLNRDAKKPLLLLLGVGSSFWLLASLNVVSLLIARATAREREFAVRSALGASRGRLLRQSIAESLVLSTIASMLGILLATVAIKLLWHAITRNLPLTNRIHIEAHVMLALVALTAITGVLVGLLPAMRASGRKMQVGLRGGAAPLASVEHQRLRSSLIAGQLMITMVMLAGAGLFLRTVMALRAVPLGFSEQNVLTGGIMQPAGLPSIGNKNDPGIAQRIYLPLLDRLNHMPGVESATLSSVMPMRSEFQITVSGKVDGKEEVAGRPFQAEGRAASPGLPETFGIPMLRGRFFSAADTSSSPAVVVVNQAFVDKYLAGTDPLGHTFGLSKGRFEAMPIVGVIGDVKQRTVTHSTNPEVYLCLAQVTPGTPFYQPITAFMQVGIRARIPAQLLRKQFEVAVDHINPDAQTINVKTIHEAVEDSFGSQTLMAHLLTGFSAMALLIAAVGLYGTVAFSVAQRTREFGVRLALGAPQESIRRLVLQKAMLPVITGLLAGDIVLWFAARLVRSYLFGVAPHDVATFWTTTFILLSAACVAAIIPARRAATIDPMQALRTE
jgi:predicted permease